MPTVACRTCGHTREVSHMEMYFPVHLFPGVTFIHCPQCKRFRFHRRLADREASKKEGKESSDKAVN